ncbi:hypothetical protein AB0G15_14270 [Streptosporangium sp. NPDC023825]|uniref:hypothetical protein n=1 Tax=Streptosporangium sp. NPDC023825 TaxID=3154909 RepID=UPI00343938D7
MTRPAEARHHAAEGKITQYLAGVPVLLVRYSEAPPAAKALIHTAMDARRLGHGPHLPYQLPAKAALGYLGAHEQIAVLSRRLPALGLFEFYRDIGGNSSLKTFGCRPDGSPARRWDWDDLM